MDAATIFLVGCLLGFGVAILLAWVLYDTDKKLREGIDEIERRRKDKEKHG